VLVGFLGGFAERLVPSLLSTLQSRVEKRIAEDRANNVATEEPKDAAPQSSANG
jgi:hypothetical protein